LRDSRGLEEVASYFEKIATTCTDPVRIKTPVESTQKPPEGGFLCGLEENGVFVRT